MNTVIQIITNPAVISLGIGFFWGLYRTLQIPAALIDLVSLYLIFSIGLKGGMCLGVTNVCTPPLITLALCGAVIGFIQPFIYFFILKKSTTLDRQTAAVIASQYGSISIVTFLTVITFLNQQEIVYDTFMSALAGIMEIPAIFSGLLLLKSAHVKRKTLLQSCLKTLYEIMSSKKISFIFIGFFVGFLLRDHQGFIIPTIILWPFTLMLILFMINTGIKIAQQRAHIYQFTWQLIAFALYTPIISGCGALLLCYFLHIQLGTGVLFAILVGSASYIAVPAIMSTHAPHAKEAIYLPLALGITLPLNLIFGIPLFYWIARMLL
jgi:hypothetical protein